MITSKSKAIETDCRSLLVYIKLLCDSTRIVWTFWRVPLQKATVCKQRKVRFAFLTNITSLSNQYLSIWPETTLNKWDHDSFFFVVVFFFFFRWPTKHIIHILMYYLSFLKVCVVTHFKVSNDWNVTNDAFVCKCTTKLKSLLLLHLSSFLSCTYSVYNNNNKLILKFGEFKTISPWFSPFELCDKNGPPVPTLVFLLIVMSFHRVSSNASYF